MIQHALTVHSFPSFFSLTLFPSPPHTAHTYSPPPPAPCQAHSHFVCIIPCITLYATIELKRSCLMFVYALPVVSFQFTSSKWQAHRRRRSRCRHRRSCILTMKIFANLFVMKAHQIKALVVVVAITVVGRHGKNTILRLQSEDCVTRRGRQQGNPKFDLNMYVAGMESAACVQCRHHTFESAV